jgi:hypothetical protein
MNRLLPKSSTWIVLFLLLVCSIPGYTQIEYEKDFNYWGWIQAYKKTGKNGYASVQYQVRLNNNWSSFSQSNIYGLYGFDYKKHWNMEGLFQYNTNHQRDLFTFYTGLTYKKNFGKFGLQGRTAWQYSRFHFTGDYLADKPYHEFRNRVRASYKFNNFFSNSIAIEPTIFLNNQKHNWEKIRFTYQFTIQPNKYQSFTLFYMIQPELTIVGSPGLNYVLGTTYQIKLPRKIKKWDNALREPFFENNEKEIDPTSLF